MDIRQMLQQWSDVRKHLVELTYKEMNQLWYNDDSHVHCFDTVNDNLSALEKFSQHIIAHGWQRKNLNQARTEYLCTLFIVQTFQTNLKEYYIHDNISHINQRNPLHIGLNDYKKWKSQLTTEYIQHLKTCDKTEDTSWIYNTLKFGNNLNSLLQALTVICLNKIIQDAPILGVKRVQSDINCEDEPPLKRRRKNFKNVRDNIIKHHNVTKIATPPPSPSHTNKLFHK